MNGYNLQEYALGKYSAKRANKRGSSVWNVEYTVEPSYNDTGLCDTLSIASDILWYQLITHCLP
jgi:hypothetical protein